MDGNNAFQIKALGVVISTFETLPRKQSLRAFPLEAFRSQPCLDRLMIFLHYPTCGVLQRTCARLHEVDPISIAQQNPFQPVRNVWGGAFPDAHGGAWAGGLAAPPISGTPGSTQRHCGSTYAQVRRACRVCRPLA